MMCSNTSPDGMVRLTLLQMGNKTSNQSPCGNMGVVIETATSNDNGNANAIVTLTETSIMGTMLVLIFVASLVANAFVFVVFCKRKSLSLSNRFVANLTICNCINTVLVIPFAFASLILQRWPFGEVWCVCTGFLMNVIVCASIFTLAVISIDRYCAVVTPLHYTMRLTSRRCAALIACIWLSALVISAPPLLGWNSIHFQLDKMVCTVRWSSSVMSDRYYTFFLISFSFLLPLLAMLWTYARIFRAARGNIVRARRNSVVRVNSSVTVPSEDTPSCHSISPSQNGQGQPQTTPINSRRRSSSVPIIRRLSQSSSRSSSLLWRKEEWKAAVTSSLVLFSFAVCWAPYFVVMGCEAVLGRPSPLLPVVSHLSTVLAMFSCACNPLVYVFRSRIVRRELRLIVRGRSELDLEVCIPTELPRRASVMRNDSGRSLRSMAEVDEDEISGKFPVSATESTLLKCDSCNSFRP